MRTLVITLGVPAAGKSTWIANQNLQDYTLSPDTIRLQYQAPETTLSGTRGITQKNDKAVWNHLFTLLENRMQNGDFTVIDATHTRSSLINRYRNLAREYRYRVIAIDFRDVPLEELHRRNSLRGLKMVPPAVIDNMYARIEHNEIPGWITVVKPDDFQLDPPMHNYAPDYTSIRFIGDIHSCATELETLLAKSETPNCFTVLVGDLFDRGPSPLKTLEILEANPNFMILEGNHDTHLKHYKSFYLAKDDKDELAFCKANNISPATRNTFKALKESGVTAKRISALRQRFAQLFHAKLGDRIIFATHAGYPTIPSTLTSTREFTKGIGKYEDIEAIQQQWINYVGDANAVQVHGHRNPNNQPVEVVPGKMYNINGSVEKGGTLEAVVFHIDGTQTMYSVQSKETYYSTPRPVSRTVPEPTEASGNLYTDMVNHKFVAVKAVDENLFACNFTTKAFKTGTYDHNSTNARGLFIRQDGSIVVRGYHKFFNHNEKEATRNDALKANLKFPVRKYSKANGYLGLVSYDTEADKWVIASKSSIHSDHKHWFEAQIKPYLTPLLKEYLTAMQLTLAFEVIEPINDPHIVKYDAPHLVLLDAISNARVFNKLSYEALLMVKDVHFKDLEVKQLVAEFQNWDELSADIRAQEVLTAPSDLLVPNGNEGFVYEDSSLFMFKFKSRWYRFWKYMRTMSVRVTKLRDNSGQAQQMREKLHTIAETKVVNYMIDHKSELANLSIIEIRDNFLKEYNEENQSKDCSI